MTKKDDGKFPENWSFDRNRLWCQIKRHTTGHCDYQDHTDLK